jgi:flavin reductase (DIM6/NTAB) family NADH-FMN oxidoreductase RutF
MELDLTGPLREDAYRILAGLVTPRPIALVTTMSPEGQVNAAPFSFFNVLGDSPPIVGFCPGDRAPGVPKDTARNIRLTHEFVVNLVDEAIAEKMNLCAATLPPGANELDHAGLTAVASSVDNRLIIGEVLRVHVREGIFDPETWLIQPAVYHPIGRMQSPNWYCRTRDMFEMQRPR